MKAVVLNKIGPPHVLKISDLEEPEPDINQVRINTQFIGVNYAEILSRKGLYGWAIKRPYILGMECSGIVDKIGENVSPELVGKKVIIGQQNGCYAEKVVAPVSQVIPALDHFSMEENAAFLINYMTAWVSMMELAHLQSDESFLVTAAAGGVGTAATQLAAAHHCTVYGLAGNDEKVDFLNTIGVKKAFNYNSERWTDQLKRSDYGVDVILEMVGGDVYKQCLNLINPFGRLVVAGFASLNLRWWNPLSWWRTWRDIPRVQLAKIGEQSVGVFATHLGYLLKDENRLLKIYENLKSFLIKNNIKPVISRIYPLEEVAEAHAYIESRLSIGKVLLKIT